MNWSLPIHCAEIMQISADSVRAAEREAGLLVSNFFPQISFTDFFWANVQDGRTNWSLPIHCVEILQIFTDSVRAAEREAGILASKFFPQISFTDFFWANVHDGRTNWSLPIHCVEIMQISADSVRVAEWEAGILASKFFGTR